MSDEEDISVDRMIDNRKLIKEVKKRPCLYDKHVKEYTNSTIKQIKWREVAEIIFAKYWNNWSGLMKDRAVEFTIKRWSNLRNCFLRELRKIVTYKGYKLRRQYVYFNDLIFLKDHIEKREQYELGLRRLGLDGSVDIKTEEISDQEDEEQAEQEGDDDCQVYDYEYLEDEESQEVPVEEAISVIEIPQSSLKRSRESYADSSDPLQSKQTKNRRSKLSISNDRNTNIMNGVEVPSPPQLNVDADVNFALSLVPMLKSLSQKEKIDAQIQILSVFKDYNSIATD